MYTKNYTPLSAQDRELVEAAKQELKKIFVPEKHYVLAVCRTTSGARYYGFNLKTTATRASVCAESIAIANALGHGEKNIDTIVILAYPEGDHTQEPAIVSPCGICRELLQDYAADAHIIIAVNAHQFKVPVSQLLTFPYKRATN